MSSLEAVWAQREDVLYPSLFGSMSRGIFPLSEEAFRRLSATAIDPRWLHLGVLEFAPNAHRGSWLYVTSGGSTPWETEPENYDPADTSWLGIEYVLETPAQADWPILALQRLLAYHVLAAHGRFGDVPLPDYGHRIPAGGAIDGGTSALRILALAEPWHYPGRAQLDSGIFDFLHVVGITEAERDHAKAGSTANLVALLREHGAAPVTDPARASVV